jgi:hypothetical protein
LGCWGYLVFFDLNDFRVLRALRNGLNNAESTISLISSDKDLGFESEEGRELLFQFVEDHPEYAILSDPDLDGIFASCIITRALNTDVSRIVYPKPSEIDLLKVSKSILIELPLSKGLTYVGKNILIDHHEPPPSISLYNGSTKVREVVFNSSFRSVSRLVFEVFKTIVEMNEEGLRILDAIDQIDSGSIDSEMADKINRAFLLNSGNEKVRNELTLTIYKMDWKNLLDWVERELSRWSVVEEAINKMRASVKTLSNIRYFTYDVTNQFEAAARRMLMLSLGKEHNGVILCIGLRRGRPVSATISAQGPLNLIKVYEELRKNDGIKAGGRENIGGIQFKADLSLDDAMTLIQRAVEKSLTKTS